MLNVSKGRRNSPSIARCVETDPLFHNIDSTLRFKQGTTKGGNLLFQLFELQRRDVASMEDHDSNNLK